ncbi:hypothetical protein BBJ28_00024828 [Nothophytophthora sp. Chile5]|nr:hypothetical protein BBJ28_00024828 [Nothophytophthora sp. Chile5]
MKNVGPSEDQAFREEANIWYGLNHPHIVNLFGACTQGYQVFVSDFAEGGRLDYYLRRDNNREQVWGLLHEAALGLRWLHSRGVTHADLKCDNILVTADGREKLADFGLSCVQECNGGKPVGALRFKAPECLRGSGPTFVSDVYSFGMCILEAVSGEFPWGNKLADNVVSYHVERGELPPKPTSGFDETYWQLVKRMCCPEPQNRLNLDFVVGALGLFANRSPCTEDVALRIELATWEEAPDIAMLAGGSSRATDLVVPGLEGRVTEALATATKLCQQMRESKRLCLRVCLRLQSLSDELDDTAAPPERCSHDDLLRSLGDTLVAFDKFLQKRSETSFVKRLANSRKVEEELVNFHGDLDKLETLLTGGDGANASEEPKWKQQWPEDRLKKLQEMQALADNAQLLHDEKGGPEFMEGLFMLKFEVDYKASDYKTDQFAPDHLALMGRVLSKLTRLSSVSLPKIPEWFIPRDDVDFNDRDFFDCGSYGTVHRGTWRKGATRGKGAKVVIKCLLVDEENAKLSFLKETEVWRQLDHPHVIKLYGACHVGTPAFFVCEDAIHGSFGEYFEQDKSHLWRLFYEAALGLGFLHAKKVVHGDLKCNNLLVGSDDKAKICDFGFSYIRSQSVGLSAKNQTDAIRWKAPECLMPVHGDPDPLFNPRFASDVYSFGMCIIEAFLGEAPYGLDDDEEIMEAIFAMKPYPQPDGMKKEDEWELVERLIHPDWTKRISLADAIDQLKLFADREEAASVHSAETRMCLHCRTRMPIDFDFCGKCGFRIAVADAADQSEDAPSRNEGAKTAVPWKKNACPDCEESVDSADRFCRHCGYFLEINPAYA